MGPGLELGGRKSALKLFFWMRVQYFVGGCRNMSLCRCVGDLGRQATFWGRMGTKNANAIGHFPR